MWSKVMMLKLPVEETKRSLTDTTPSTWTHSSTLAAWRVSKHLVLSGDIEHCTECRKVQNRHFVIELSGKG